MEILYLLKIWVLKIRSNLTFRVWNRPYIEVSVCCSISLIFHHGDNFLHQIKSSVLWLIHRTLTIKIRKLKSDGNIFVGQVFRRGISIRCLYDCIFLDLSETPINHVTQLIPKNTSNEYEY
jgi:hypothetical protein